MIHRGDSFGEEGRFDHPQFTEESPHLQALRTVVIGTEGPLGPKIVRFPPKSLAPARLHPLSGRCRRRTAGRGGRACAPGHGDRPGWDGHGRFPVRGRRRPLRRRRRGQRGLAATGPRRAVAAGSRAGVAAGRYGTYYASSAGLVCRAPRSAAGSAHYNCFHPRWVRAPPGACGWQPAGRRGRPGTGRPGAGWRVTVAIRRSRSITTTAAPS